MRAVNRRLLTVLKATLKREKSVLLLGPRQTGKTTLVRLLGEDLYLNFMDAQLRQNYERTPGSLISEVKAIAARLNRKPLIILDEIQKIPDVMDAIQVLIDEGIAQFVITGSSARQLRNMLPGRVIKYQLSPLSLAEFPTQELLLMLLNGSLPGIISIENQNEIDDELRTYVSVYLEEEIRKEALVRNLGAFSRFLQLAASQSGNLVSFRALSQDVGIAHTTIAEYYRILEDCMIVERVDPITKSQFRSRLTKSSKYLFFDLGIRRLAAQEGLSPSQETYGHLFEQWVGLELNRFLRFKGSGKLRFWRDSSGPEVDWVIEIFGEYIPIEVKWTTSPTLKDCRHVITFLNEYKEAKRGFIVCRIPRPMQLAPGILAIPWEHLGEVFSETPSDTTHAKKEGDSHPTEDD